MSEILENEGRAGDGSGYFSDIDPKTALVALWRKKLVIICAMLVSAGSAYGISLLLPCTFEAQATVLPTTAGDSGSSLAGGFASQLSGVAMMSGLGGLMGGGRSADIVEILHSRSMAARVIDKYALATELKGWRTRGELITQVVQMVAIKAPDIKSKSVGITAMAPRAELAARMANGYVEQLKSMLDEIGYSSAARSRKFVENQLAKTKGELADSENRLATFQATNRLASLPDTVMASIRAISDLEAQRVGTDVQLQTNDQTLQTQKARVQSLQGSPESVMDLEIRSKGLAAQRAALSKAQASFLKTLTELPPKAMSLARLQRDVQVRNAIFLALSQQYETDVISESRESDAFLPLDKAEIPDWPSSPKKKMIVIAGLVMGFLLAAGMVLVKERSTFRGAASRGHH